MIGNQTLQELKTTVGDKTPWNSHILSPSMLDIE